jgi:hypothetical protein
MTHFSRERPKNMIPHFLESLLTGPALHFVIYDATDRDRSCHITLTSTTLAATMRPSREAITYDVNERDFKNLRAALAKVLGSKSFISCSRVAPGLSAGAGRGGAR